MASTSVKSAVARIAGVSYANLEELKRVVIPKEEQEVVRKEIQRLQDEKVRINTPSASSPPVPPQASTTPSTTAPSTVPSSSSSAPADSRLVQFEAGVPLKCVRIPKREQRKAQMAIDEMNTLNNLS
ncbi:Protein CBG07005 [Caenorhabditis briggsae]|uniref:Protein CBG07005 n=1 Tax=Caenorhabditis briggsae TaxID=6238 RepID=A8X3X9_CAEBR|nr:Protein CBG07005 [Caenorhabditis briggsae]CAP27339.2 Protein CBG07005 [Caenorhabditis briggsae]